MQSLDEQEEGGPGDAQEDESMEFTWHRGWQMADLIVEERQRLADALKHHQRDRNRAPSEPAGRQMILRVYHIKAKGMQNYSKL